MTRWEQFWLLAAVMAVSLPVILLARVGKHVPSGPPSPSAGPVAVGPSVPLPPELRVDPAELDVIRDNTLDRPEEHAVFLHLMEILRRASPEQLQRASLGRITYAQLQRQPNQYRGKLVTIRGTVRRVVAAHAPKNDRGIDRYYQLWIQPADAPSWPMVAECLELPRGFPAGPDVSEDAQLTGFFFKRWAYIAQDQPRTAPTLLARTIEWEKPAPTPSAPSPANWNSALIALAGVIAVAVWIAWRWRTPPRPRRAQPGQAEPDFSRLEPKP